MAEEATKELELQDRTPEKMQQDDESGIYIKLTEAESSATKVDKLSAKVTRLNPLATGSAQSTKK